MHAQYLDAEVHKFSDSNVATQQIPLSQSLIALRFRWSLPRTNFKLAIGRKNFVGNPLDNVVMALQTRLAKQVEIHLVVRVGETQRGPARQPTGR